MTARPFIRRRKQRKPSLVLAGGVALVVMVGALLLQQTAARRDSVSEVEPPSNLAALLPAGALQSPFAPLELPDDQHQAYLVGYTLNDVPYAAYLRWDAADRAYGTASTVALSSAEQPLHGQPTLTSLPLGTDAPIAVLARASEGASTDAVIVLVPRGDAYVVADVVDADGRSGQAHFLSGATVRHADKITFDDVDADGDRDAVATSSAFDDAGVETKTIQVFAWNDSAFRYDANLSWTLTVSQKVFPEPDAKP